MADFKQQYEDYMALDPYSKLLSLFEVLERIKYQYNQSLNQGATEEDFEQHLISQDEDLRVFEDQIPELLDGLYIDSQKNNIYYFDCPFKVYTSFFEKRFSDFQKQVPDGRELDFYKAEVNYFSNPVENRLINDKYNYHIYMPYNDRYKVSLIRKLEFLDSKLKDFSLGVKFKENIQFGDDYYRNQYYYTSIDVVDAKKSSFILKTPNLIQQKDDLDKNEPNDITNTTTKKLTANQIVILLLKTGFFDHPKIESLPNTKQAFLLSKITGLNEKNLKTCIEKIGKSPNKLGNRYSVDEEKIERLLGDLE